MRGELLRAAHSNDEGKTFGIPNAPGTTNTPGDWAVTDDAWVREKKHWTDTAFGKAGIEFVSRITLGGLFYSLMENSQTMKQLGNYSHSNHKKMLENGEKPGILERIAYLLDNTIGRSVVGIADRLYFRGSLHKEYNPSTGKKEVVYDSNGTAVTRARQFARFRENRNLHDNQTRTGRSLGAEMTVVTASFAAMSAGSAVMRDILSGVLNPKERASWSNEGKFDPVHIAKKVTGKLWKIGTYNAGEDMAVALPYVLYMRGQRNLLDKVFKGFRYSSDSVDNGGGLRIDDKGRPTGHFIAAGALDLQGRFTVYNVFTQLYRDVYNNIGDSFKQWWKGDKIIGAPEWATNPLTIPKHLYKSTKHIVRYTAISAIRSVIQMTPSVPFFSFFRVPGSKVNGMAVHGKHGALHFVKTDEEGKAMYKNGKPVLDTAVRANLGGYYYKDKFHGHDPRYNRVKKSDLPPMAFADGTPFENRAAYFYSGNNDGTKFDPHGFSAENRPLSNSVMMKTTDSIAKWMHNITEHGVWEKAFTPILNVADKLGYKGTSEISDKNSFLRKRIIKDAAMAGIPYASYFAAKVFTREAYVNEQMNMGVERFLDGILKFNRSEIAAGISEISNTILRQPLEDPERQAKLIEKHLETPSDTSPRPVDWNADLQIAALKRHEKGIKLDNNKVVRDLNQERSDYYTNKIAKNDARDKALADKKEQQDWASKQAEMAETENAASLT